VLGKYFHAGLTAAFPAADPLPEVVEVISCSFLNLDVAKGADIFDMAADRLVTKGKWVGGLSDLLF